MHIGVTESCATHYKKRESDKYCGITLTSIAEMRLILNANPFKALIDNLSLFY